MATTTRQQTPLPPATSTTAPHSEASALFFTLDLLAYDAALTQRGDEDVHPHQDYISRYEELLSRGREDCTAVSSGDSGDDCGDDCSDAGRCQARVCSASGCGKELTGNPDTHKRCTRCKHTFYCGRACQKEHWKHGGHKAACTEPPCCAVCLDDEAEPLPIPSGCGCRGTAGLAHVTCKVRAAVHNGPGFHSAWYACGVCSQEYTGEMQLSLARALMRRMRRRPKGDPHRSCATNNLGRALDAAHRYAEAETEFRQALAVYTRVLGGNHENTLATTMNLAASIDNLGRHTEASALSRQVLAVQQQTLGSQHPHTLMTTTNLARSLTRMGSHVEAETLCHQALAVQRSVLGPEHIHTMFTQCMLANVARDLGRADEAESLYRKTLAVQRRVLGEDHPETADTARNLDALLAGQAAVL